MILRISIAIISPLDGTIICCVSFCCANATNSLLLAYLEPFLIGHNIQSNKSSSFCGDVRSPYYNANLLAIPQQRETGLGFIDDITYGVEGFTDKGNTRKLNQLLREAEEWRKKHGVQFEMSKYILVHFTRNYNQATNAAITIGKVIIEPSNEAKYLGVIFDEELRFKTHLQYITKRCKSSDGIIKDCEKQLGITIQICTPIIHSSHLSMHRLHGHHLA